MASNDLQHQQSQTLQQRGAAVPDFLRAWNEIDRVFDQMAAGFGLPNIRRLNTLGGRQQESLLPATEVTENDNEYRVAVELPGIEPKDVDVSIDNNVLSIRAERRQQDERQKQGQHNNIHISERVYGVVQRSLQLNNDVERDNVKADFRNGLLTLTLPKSQQARQQRRKIEIQG